MNISLLPQPAALSSAHRPMGKVEKAAQEFESVLLGPLLESLEKSFSEIGEGGALGNGDYSYMAAQALSSGMAGSGGIGIARMIVGSLERTKVPPAEVNRG